MKRGVIKVATCQFAIGGNVKRNAAAVRRQMAQARAGGADVAHFPECALTGYPGSQDRANWDGFDWAVLRAQTEAIMAEARRLKIWAVFGSAHRLTGRHRPHNCLYAVNPAGRIVDRYDKRFCTGSDLKFYSPGDHFTVFEINSVRCGMLICYDVRFCELYREYRKLGVQFLFQAFHNARTGATKPTIHTVIMRRSVQALAAMNYFFVSAPNSSAYYSLWPSVFVTPDGRIESQLKANRAGITIDVADTHKEYYDPSRAFRDGAMCGVLNSGRLVKDARSRDRWSL